MGKKIVMSHYPVYFLKNILLIFYLEIQLNHKIHKNKCPIKLNDFTVHFVYIVHCFLFSLMLYV